MIRKTLGTILICISIGVTLQHILVYKGWQWDEMLGFPHHESIALVTVVVGLFLLATAVKWK